jgi:heptosyltransferase-3
MAAKRVLVYRLGSLGDHLVALPCYRLVRRAFPGAEVRLLTNIPVSGKAAAAEAVLDGSGLVDGYETYVLGERGAGALLQLWWKIARWRPEVLVYLAGARGLKAAQRDAWFFRLCGVKRLVGVPLTEEMQRNRALETRRLGAMETTWFEQEGLRLARCVAELGDAAVGEQASWEPGLTAAERAEGARLVEGLAGKKFFAMSLGTKAQSNQWGVEWGTELWDALLRKMAKEWPGCGLVILGAKDEWLASEDLVEGWRSVPSAGPVVNLCGTCSPRVSAAVMERAVMFLGHDSGPGHMAAAVGTPVVGVFSARMKAGEWVPHGEHVRVVQHWVDCGGCLLETCIEQRKKCILSIGVDEVLAVVKEQFQVISGRD